MSQPAVSNVRYGMFATPNEGGSEGIFDNYFGYPLSSTQGSGELDSTMNDIKPLGNNGDTAFSELSLNDTSQPANAGLAYSSYSTWQPRVHPSNAVEQVPKSRMMVHRMRAESESISGSDLLSIEGKNKPWMPPITNSSQLPSAQPITPSNNRSRPHTPSTSFQRQLGYNIPSTRTHPLAANRSYTSVPYTSNHLQLSSRPSWEAEAGITQPRGVSVPPSPPSPSGSTHAAFSSRQPPATSKAHQPSSTLIAPSESDSTRSGAADLTSNGNPTMMDSFMDSFNWNYDTLTDLDFSQSQNWQSEMPSFELASRPEEIYTGGSLNGISYNANAVSNITSAPMLYQTSQRSMSYDASRHNSLQMRESDQASYQSDCSDDSERQSRQREKVSRPLRSISTNKSPGGRSRSRIVKPPRGAKSLSRVRSDSGAGVDFVNFTANDSRRILTGVAPSGSSKTKARREREASERRRKISEVAARAIREAGGDIDELRRQGLLEEISD